MLMVVGGWVGVVVVLVCLCVCPCLHVCVCVCAVSVIIKHPVLPTLCSKCALQKFSLLLKRKQLKIADLLNLFGQLNQVHRTGCLVGFSGVHQLHAHWLSIAFHQRNWKWNAKHKVSSDAGYHLQTQYKRLCNQYTDTYITCMKCYNHST